MLEGGKDRGRAEHGQSFKHLNYQERLRSQAISCVQGTEGGRHEEALERNFQRHENRRVR
jgi:hypothetical protein